MPKKLTIIDVQNFLKENDINNQCTLISTEYVNSDTPLKLRCNLCGNKFERDFHHLKRNRFSCNECAQKKRPANKATLITVEQFLEKNDKNKECELLSEVYVNASEPLLFKFNLCGNNFKISFKKVKLNRFCCPECGIRRGAKALKYSKDDVQKIIEKDKYIIIGDYINSHSPVLCQCSKGHEFNLFFSEYLNRGRGCPKCAIERNSGVNHWNYQNGGHQEVIDALRHAIIPWKKECLQKANYTCDISGENSQNLIVHHLKINFSDLVKQASINTKVPILNSVSEYNYEDFQRLSNELLKLHTIDNGVVIERKLHDEFHRIYGKNNNSEEQYIAFKKSIINKKL